MFSAGIPVMRPRSQKDTGGYPVELKRWLLKHQPDHIQRLVMPGDVQLLL
jgi:hypothetical protein